MDPKIKLYISDLPVDRQNILAKIHETIIEMDKSIEATVEPMMGNTMIVYKSKGWLKYGLASMKNYMSFHVMPIYGSKSLHSRYKILLNKANFQKGCINFDNEDEMPMDIVQKLIYDCSKVDLISIREDYMKLKKSKSKN